MPALLLKALPWLAAAGAAAFVGKSIQDAGEGVDLAGSGALKFAIAGAIGAGAFVAVRRLT